MTLFAFPEWDVDLFRSINSMHTKWLDPVMITLSSPLSWTVLFLIVFYFVIRKSKFWGIREIMLIAATMITNNILNSSVKIVIQRLRPCENEALYSTIHLLENCSNDYSFFSAHSSNAFCLAICTALYFRNKYYTAFILSWATIVAYSRIYVGKHYPLDVICGITFGVIISFAGDYLLERYRKQSADTH